MLHSGLQTLGWRYLSGRRTDTKLCTCTQ